MAASVSRSTSGSVMVLRASRGSGPARTCATTSSGAWASRILPGPVACRGSRLRHPGPDVHLGPGHEPFQVERLVAVADDEVHDLVGDLQQVVEERQRHVAQGARRGGERPELPQPQPDPVAAPADALQRSPRHQLVDQPVRRSPTAAPSPRRSRRGSAPAARSRTCRAPPAPGRGRTVRPRHSRARRRAPSERSRGERGVGYDRDLEHQRLGPLSQRRHDVVEHLQQLVVGGDAGRGAAQALRPAGEMLTSSNAGHGALPAPCCSASRSMTA